MSVSYLEERKFEYDVERRGSEWGRKRGCAEGSMRDNEAAAGGLPAPDAAIHQDAG